MSKDCYQKKYTLRHFVWDFTLSVCTGGIWLVYKIFKAANNSGN